MAASPSEIKMEKDGAREYACNVPLKDDCDAGDFLPDFPPSYSGSR